MVVLAAALARGYFGADVPDALATAEAGDPALNAVAERIEARWLGQEPAAETGTKDSAGDGDGCMTGRRGASATSGGALCCQGRAMSRASRSDRVARLPAYVPIKIVDEILLRPGQ